MDPCKLICNDSFLKGRNKGKTNKMIFKNLTMKTKKTCGVISIGILLNNKKTSYVRTKVQIL